MAKWKLWTKDLQSVELELELIQVTELLQTSIFTVAIPVDVLRLVDAYPVTY